MTTPTPEPAPAAPALSERVPFVVFGASKSGTTWVQKLLDTHPDVRCHFQLPLFPLSPEGRARLHKQVPPALSGSESPWSGFFGDDAGEEAYWLRGAYLQGLQCLRPGYVERVMADPRLPRVISGVSGEAEATLRDFHHRVLRAVGTVVLEDEEARGKQVVGTKAHTDLRMLFDVFPEARVVHVLRDGRDVCVSKRFHTLRQKAFFPGDERSRALAWFNRHGVSRRAVRAIQRRTGLFGESWYRDVGEEGPLFSEASLTKYAAEWVLSAEYVRSFERERPDQVLTVRYEDLRADTSQQLARMLSFLGADASAAVVEEIVERNDFDRLKKSHQVEGKRSFFRKGKSGDWRNHFTPSDTALFKRLAGDLLVELGYEEHADWTLV